MKKIITICVILLVLPVGATAADMSYGKCGTGTAAQWVPIKVNCDGTLAAQVTAPTGQGFSVVIYGTYNGNPILIGVDANGNMKATLATALTSSSDWVSIGNIPTITIGGTTGGALSTTSFSHSGGPPTQTTITVGTTIVAVPATPLAGRTSVYFQTSQNNTAPIWYCWNSNCVANATGANILYPGQSVTFPVADPAWMVSSTAGQTVTVTESK